MDLQHLSALGPERFQRHGLRYIGRYKTLELHARLQGKLEIKSRITLKDRKDLALAYTPGVAQPCLEIQKDPVKSYELTRRWNTVAVVTDGTTVLGLGDIGPEAGMPVMGASASCSKNLAAWMPN